MPAVASDRIEAQAIQRVALHERCPILRNSWTLVRGGDDSCSTPLAQSMTVEVRQVAVAGSSAQIAVPSHEVAVRRPCADTRDGRHARRLSHSSSSMVVTVVALLGPLLDSPSPQKLIIAVVAAGIEVVSALPSSHCSPNCTTALHAGLEHATGVATVAEGPWLPSSLLDRCWFRRRRRS